MPGWGIEPTTFWFMRGHTNQLSHPARASEKDFKTPIIKVFREALTGNEKQNPRKEIENIK